MKIRILFFAAIFLASTLAFPAEEVKNLNLSAEGIQTLRIDSGAGFLNVEGKEGLSAIEVKAEIYVKGLKDEEMKEFIEDHVKLNLERKGDRAVLVSGIEWSPFSFREVRIDLTVKVPRAMNLDIDDGSGTVEVTNIRGDVVLDDGSGSIHVENVEGDLEIEDGSGDITVRNITGDVQIDDGSGGISVSHIGGSVTVDDGSGSIDIHDVEKDVILEDTGSGSEHISDVKGKVIKKDD